MKLIVCLLIAGFIPLAALETIQVSGKNFVTPSGETIIFQGVNSSDPDKLVKDGHWNEAYFAQAAEWGANVVRIPVHPSAWRERSPQGYLPLLDQGIQWAKQHQLYVIIDWHSIGNLQDRLFQHKSYETSVEETTEFWRIMAARFKDEPTVFAYELYNEPTVTGKMAGMTWPEWKGLMNDMIAEVRKIDALKIILIAGFDWAYDLKPIKEDAFDLPNIAYVSHPYPMKRPEPWEEKWEVDWGFVADHHPVILTEIGFCLAGEKGEHVPVISTEVYGPAITGYCERKGISWVAWVFDPNWAPMMFSDWDFTPTTQGKFFKEYWQAGRRQ